MKQGPVIPSTDLICYHCGEPCSNENIIIHDKHFCCDGCLFVYNILSQNGMCTYYDLNKNPGLSQKITIRKDKFLFLEDASIQQSLISFKDAQQTHISFYLPQMHCSSCLWLLEQLHRLHEGIISCKVNFERKEADLIFNHDKISLREVAELLTGIGYEPYISYNDMGKKKKVVDRKKIFRLGVAGFCFANIMLMSFPEYLGIDDKEENLLIFFRYLNLFLSLPVFFYSAGEFYTSAWNALKQKFLNIDAPIVLAIWVTFARSLYEVLTATGSGYFDSMTGIVFFMLAGRVLQDRTHRQLNFDRDYTSYFPVAVTRINDDKNTTVTLPDIQLNDTLLIHHQELIPADGIITRGRALIDYSFVTGESLPVAKEMGEIVYAGGKQVGGNIEILVIKEVAQSYLTRLWNKDIFNSSDQTTSSFVHGLSRWFTWIVFVIACIAGLYWTIYDTGRSWNAITAVLIIACPCALLLSNTFTNGNILRRLAHNHFYLRHATVIEKMASIDTIVFDKTGTLTAGTDMEVVYDGKPLSTLLKQKIATLAAQSTHPLSKGIAVWAGTPLKAPFLAFEEKPGKGIEGMVDGDLITLGSGLFITGKPQQDDTSTVYIAVEGQLLGRFRFRNQYRQSVPMLLRRLQKHFKLAIVSGDNDGELSYFRKLLGPLAALHFHQQPEDKLNVVQHMQQDGHHVLMIGDGLNDSGALKQADGG
ncbi:MAG: heavy metal translocating P-type ATPase metal-binding domain-containing protein, partial [Chitinophagaceae bacterium]|nr:heavy metal translocating P-type ATPase metal-binding domain-containing protein [Chitinophagaceae bacterium]